MAYTDPNPVRLSPGQRKAVTALLAAIRCGSGSARKRLVYVERASGSDERQSPRPFQLQCRSPPKAGKVQILLASGEFSRLWRPCRPDQK